MVDIQRAIIRDSLRRHGGREHQTTGDGFFLEFPSAINAVQCAIDVQTALHERERFVPADRRIQVRIGIHLGDILTNEEDLFGNGVNIAARVEPLAAPGGICITRQIHDQVLDRIAGTKFKKDGRKNAPFAVQVYESYKSGSCMVFPLLSQGRLVGVVTFADKRGPSVFSGEDFTAALELSSTLALMLDNQKMRTAFTDLSLVSSNAS